MRIPFVYLFLIFSMFMLLTINAIGQKKEFRAGVFFNINAMDISRHDHNGIRAPAGKGMAGGISLGASLKRKFKSGLQVATELRYINKGSIYDGVQGNRYVSGILKLNYIEVPLLIGYSFNPYNVNFNIEGGIAYGKLFLSDNSIALLTNTVPYVGINGDFKDWNISGIAILKWALNFRKANNVFMGFRFEHSLASIHEKWNLYNINLGLQFEYEF